MATLVASIERSRRFGSPLADQLRRQASALRRDSRRAIEERAARAAPKIQLVVALVLVPSVLLMIAAGLIANAGTLLAASDEIGSPGGGSMHLSRHISLSLDVECLRGARDPHRHSSDNRRYSNASSRSRFATAAVAAAIASRSAASSLWPLT